MSDLARVAAALIESARSGEMSVLATVVRTEGSTYRRVGARLVALPDGVRAGTVSAGCLEREIVARVTDVLAAGSPAVVTYDTRSPDDLVWGFGLGCGGLIELMLEPLTPARAAAKAARLKIVANARQRTLLATVIRAPADAPICAGDQALVLSATESLGWLDRALYADFRRAARDAWTRGCSVVVQHACKDNTIDVIYEVIAPRVRLAICGAGIDAVPVAAAAKRLGWHVTLIDDRPAMAAAHRWPDADRIIVPRPTAIVESVAEADSEAAIIMSHSFERDLDFLRGWLDTAARYIGVMGPHHRVDAMFAALSARGVHVDAAARDRIWGPVGLDLGAETPEEIALAIVGEVQAVHAGRTAGFLAQRAGSIHAAA